METTGENSGTHCHERHVGDEDKRDQERDGVKHDVCVTAVNINAPIGHFCHSVFLSFKELISFHQMNTVFSIRNPGE